MAAAVKSVGFLAQLNNSLKRFAFRASGFNQYGLYYDDCLHETPDVIEALERLPQNIKDERNFRMQRALQLSLVKNILPKEQWISFEEDREKGRYLQPYLKEVIKERKEQEEWNKK
ncbi:cytochrome b-c1 complex subunit 7 [Procambarus clarkii]|uniref:cytochrome b-c1 complex subunit 7 n=1 Tax=Procambarus clarkii TaxID=6728 RepID=UPI001E67617D|nr:cytochrome b-c1 complex subunit 7-like [Procambarus clarkii]